MVNAEVAIFARLPVAGKVKTRLAAGVGFEKAATFYKACAEHIFVETSRCTTAQAKVHCSMASDLPGVRDWVAAAGLRLPCTCQVARPDLGVRMHASLESALDQHHISKALVIGTDIPDISASIVDRAVAALDSHQLVLGPAFDGGYYLLGTTCAALQLFEGIEWSSDKVLQQTLRQVKVLQLDVAPLDTLPTLRDIDTLQDLERWRSQSPPGHPIEAVVDTLLNASASDSH